MSKVITAPAVILKQVVDLALEKGLEAVFRLFRFDKGKALMEALNTFVGVLVDVVVALVRDPKAFIDALFEGLWKGMKEFFTGTDFKMVGKEVFAETFGKDNPAVELPKDFSFRELANFFLALADLTLDKFKQIAPGIATLLETPELIQKYGGRLAELFSDLKEGLAAFTEKATTWGKEALAGILDALTVELPKIIARKLLLGPFGAILSGLGAVIDYAGQAIDGMTKVLSAALGLNVDNVKESVSSTLRTLLKMGLAVLIAVIGLTKLVRPLRDALVKATDAFWDAIEAIAAPIQAFLCQLLARLNPNSPALAMATPNAGSLSLGQGTGCSALSSSGTGTGRSGSTVVGTKKCRGTRPRYLDLDEFYDKHGFPTGPRGPSDDYLGGRPVGVDVTLVRKNLDTGTGPPPTTLKPPGWDELPPGNDRARAHLLAKRLGGDGYDARNIVAMHRFANAPAMSNCEARIYRAVRDGECVVVKVRVRYRRGEDLPQSVSIEAVGDRQFMLRAQIPNIANPPTICGGG